MHRRAEIESSPSVEFRKVVLPNGLDLILHVDRKLPVVHVNQWYHVGSKNEQPGRTGFAHLFEHLMFQGSKNVPGEYFQHVEKAGANLREGGVNGTTDFDRTNYFATVPSGNLEFLLWLESDRLATLHESTTQQKLDGQREVVRNERRQSYENQPYGRAWLAINESLHPKGHPYSWDVIGSHEDLQAATLEDVARFFKRFYTPNNLSLTIAGDFDPDEAQTMVERWFGSIPPGPALERPRRWTPTLEGRRLVEIDERAPQDRIYLCWPVAALGDVDEAPLEIATRVLSEGLSSRLNRALVYDRHLCTGVQAFYDPREISGVLCVAATLRGETTFDEVEETVHQILARLGVDGPADDELERAKTRWEFDFISGLERIGGFGGKADRLNQYNTFHGDPGLFERDLGRYRAVDAAAVASAVREWLPAERNLRVRFARESSRRAAATIDRSAVPPLGADASFTAPAVHQEVLPGGLELFVVSRHDLPKISVSLAVRGGAIADPAGKEGLAQLLASTIDLGTTARSALELEDELGALGTSFSASASREMIGIGMEVLSRNIGPALAVLADVARNASFPAEEVERERNRHLDSLEQQANHPSAIAAKLRPMLLFGERHPYGRPVTGTLESVATITPEDLRNSHQQLWCAANAAIVFCGDVDPENARELALEHLGEWRSGERFEPPIPSSGERVDGDLFLVDKADAPQSVIVQVMAGPARKSERLAAFRLADAVWGGGGFGTRLNLNLREDKGYSYGVFSSWGGMEQSGAWWAAGSVQSDRTAESLVEFERELRALAGERPISSEELEAARSARVRGYAQQFESLSRIAMQIVDLWIAGLPMSEMQKQFDDTVTATEEEVRAAAERWATPEQARVLVIGDLSQIEQPVREVAKGRVVLLDAEGRPIR